MLLSEAYLTLIIYNFKIFIVQATSYFEFPLDPFFPFWVVIYDCNSRYKLKLIIYDRKTFTVQATGYFEFP
jgi:hypothetical protein